MALATQCPHCYTSFRVANDQLKLYAGMVRCGACKQTFNGIEHLIPPGSTPKQAPEQTQLQTQEESAATRQTEQPQLDPQPDPAVMSKTATDHNDGLDLENNLRALLQEIKVRQLDEEITANQNTEVAPPSSIESEAAPAPGNSAKEALVHLEVLEIKEEPHTDHADKVKPNALTASIDFDLDDDHSPIVVTREPVKQTLDAEDIEEIRSLEIAIESELDLYGDGESKVEREEEQSIASTINSGTLTNNFRVENLSPEVPTEEEQDPPSPPANSATHTTEVEETPDFVRRAQRHQRYGKWTSIALSLGVLVGLIVAIAQSSYFFRNAIAAEYPQAKPHLLKFCQIAKCEIKLPAQRSQLEISGSELQIVTNDPLVNELNFQIQNKGKSAQAWPHLELILKDIRGKTVLQKAIPPSAYLENKALIATGIPANSESAHKLNFELSIPKASSYTVELFYP